MSGQIAYEIAINIWDADLVLYVINPVLMCMTSTLVPGPLHLCILYDATACVVEI